MSKRVAEIVVDTLQQAGVRRCYGIVGDTLNHVTDALHRSEIDWVHVRHEEVAGFAAGADSLVSGELTACAGSCGPGGLHFINGVFESNRNRAPMVLIASQVVTSELGMEFPQEVDFKAVYASCSVFCEQVHSPEQARRVVALACQAAISRRGVAVVILPADISQAEVKHDVPFSVHYTQPVLRPSDDELRDLAARLQEGSKIGLYCGSGVEGALTNEAKRRSLSGSSSVAFHSSSYASRCAAIAASRSAQMPRLSSKMTPRSPSMPPSRSSNQGAVRCRRSAVKM